jgi:hypothetical protein
VRASNGMWFGADCAVQDMPLRAAYLIFAGNLPRQRNSPKLLAQLRLAARFGAIIASVDTGGFALAQAGLIGREEEPDSVLHWEAEPTLRERFPSAHPLNRLYLLSQSRTQCAGGVATLDTMLDLVARFAGEALANEVPNALVHTRRSPEVKQRNDTPIESGQYVGLGSRADAEPPQPQLQQHLSYQTTSKSYDQYSDRSPSFLCYPSTSSCGPRPTLCHLGCVRQADCRSINFPTILFNHLVDAHEEWIGKIVPLLLGPLVGDDNGHLMSCSGPR